MRYSLANCHQMRIFVFANLRKPCPFSDCFVSRSNQLHTLLLLGYYLLRYEANLTP